MSDIGVSDEELKELDVNLTAFNRKQEMLANGTLSGEELEKHLEHLKVLKLAVMIIKDPRNV